MSDESGIADKDEDGLLAAEFALGLLTAHEHAQVAARLRTDAGLRSELRHWRARFAALDDDFAELAPPAAVLAGVEDRLFGPRTRPGLWDSLLVWRSLAGAAAAVAIVAVGLNLTAPHGVDPKLFASQLVAALQAEGSNVSFVAVYDPTSASVRLTALSGDAVTGKDYELWAIEGSKAPISMGVVPLDAKVQVKLPASVLSGWGAGTVLAVTLEQKGGSPTGAPEGPIVAKGAATEI